MKSHLESGATKRAKSVTKPAAAVRSQVARKSVSGSAGATAAKGKEGAAAARTSKAAKDASAKNDGRRKVEKDKLIRDGFTIPESEYGLIAAIKKRCLAKGMAVKKSEVLRAAIISFAAQSDAAVIKALKGVEVLKTGRSPSTR